MKKYLILALSLFSLTACNNDENKANESNVVDVAKAIDFKVDFADYNESQDLDVTRANKETKLEEKTIVFDNGILAKYSLQRDTTKQSRKAVTRVLPDDTYTMMAYDAATHAFKGAMTGTIVSGAFTSADAKKRLILNPGTYDFVLFNSKVSRSGNNLTVERTDAADALIGRTQQIIYAYPNKQQVSFVMKHVGAKVKIKLTSYMPSTGATSKLESINATDVPSSSVYDASTGKWSVGTGQAVSANITYGTTSQESNKYITKSNEETAFMPATDISKLKLTFTAGTIYNLNMTGGTITFNPATELKLEHNGAYILNVNLLYNFLYLMSDGTTGFLSETTFGGGTKTPIAVVLSRSKHMAVALKNANNGARVNWCTQKHNYDQNITNTHYVADLKTALTTNITSGYDETYDPSYSTSIVQGDKRKGFNSDFPAFTAAVNYDPGVPYTGLKPIKWYLPSYSDWKWFYQVLGGGKASNVTAIMVGYQWYEALVNLAFTQVGIPAYSLQSDIHTSTEGRYKAYTGHMYISGGTILWRYYDKWKPSGWAYVRPFVRYEDPD